MPVDPVCGMEVSTTKLKAVYKGKLYYFCSDSCKRRFEENPEYYLTQGPKGH